MKTLKKMWFVVLVLATSAPGQNKTIVVQPSDVDQVLIGAEEIFLPDGGCLIRAKSFDTTVNGVKLPPSNFYSFNGAKCAAVVIGAMKAVHLDVGVGDGGTP